MGEGEGRGTMADLLAILAAALTTPPAEAVEAMALVIHPGAGGDHLGLTLGGKPSPGGFELLPMAIHARTQPHSTVLLEWTLAGEAGHRYYRGWAVWLTEGGLAWCALSPAAVRAAEGLWPGRLIGDDPLARFDP